MRFLKKIKSEGFTLIELIATIALLAVIVAISFVSINAVIRNNKKTQYDNLITGIKIAAREYYEDNKYSEEKMAYTSNGEIEIPFSVLIIEGYLTGPVVDPYTNKKIENGFVTIKIDNGKITEYVISGIPNHEDEAGNSNSTTNDDQIVINEDIGNSGAGSNSTSNGSGSSSSSSTATNNNGGNNNNNNNNNNNTNNNVYYTLTYDCNIPICYMNGASHSIQTSEVSLNPSSSVDVSTESYSCYCEDSFRQIGWNTDRNASAALSSYEMPSGDATLYAIYTME